MAKPHVAPDVKTSTAHMHVVGRALCPQGADRVQRKKCLLPTGYWSTASLLLGRPPKSFEVPTDFIQREFFYKFANCNELIPFVKLNFVPMIKNLFVHDYLSRRFERNKGGREVEGRLLGRCHFDVEDGCNALRRLHRCTEDSARVENESFLNSMKLLKHEVVTSLTLC